MRFRTRFAAVAVGVAVALGAGCDGTKSSQTAATSTVATDLDDPASAAAAAAESTRRDASATAEVLPRRERRAPVLRGRAPRLGGGVQPLGAYRGNVLMLVNTATECGFTDQLGDLQSAYDRWREEGLVVLGMPSNDFGDQEPRSNGQIRDFCELNYGVSFPMFAKTTVTGTGAHPTYRAIAEQAGPRAAPPEWNFTKFLLDREGRIAARLAPWIAPDGPEAEVAIEALLAEGTSQT